MHSPNHPLQTRACFVSPATMLATSELVAFAQARIEEGYNLLILPALHQGTPLFDVTRSGILKGGNCPARRALQLLAPLPVDVWLSFDLLTAGDPKRGRLSTLASGNRDWLMKNIEGSFRVPGKPQIPALFCWTALEFRRYVGNMLVNVIEGYPIDGILIDLVNLPRTTEDPSTWMSLGFCALQRMREELGFNIESFLMNPSMKRFRRIEEWRGVELRRFIENLKARARKARHNLPLCLLADVHNADDPFMPWEKCFSEGLVEELMLRVEPKTIEAVFSAVDTRMEEPRPILAALDNEGHLRRVAELKPPVMPIGYCLLNPAFNESPVFPDPDVAWQLPLASERSPIAAGSATLIRLTELSDKTSQFGVYIRRLKDYLEFCGDKVKYEDILVVRGDLLFLRGKLDSNEITPGGQGEEIRQKLDLAIRLFQLIPAPTVLI